VAILVDRSRLRLFRLHCAAGLFTLYNYLETPTKLYGMRVAERLKSRSNPGSRGLQQDPQRRAERRGATAVFAPRWPAKTDQRTRTGTKAEQIRMRSSISEDRRLRFRTSHLPGPIIRTRQRCGKNRQTFYDLPSFKSMAPNQVTVTVHCCARSWPTVLGSNACAVLRALFRLPRVRI
jgi:hypothetical protein